MPGSTCQKLTRGAARATGTMLFAAGGILVVTGTIGAGTSYLMHDQEMAVSTPGTDLQAGLKIPVVGLNISTTEADAHAHFSGANLSAFVIPPHFNPLEANADFSGLSSQASAGAVETSVDVKPAGFLAPLLGSSRIPVSWGGANVPLELREANASLRMTLPQLDPLNATARLTGADASATLDGMSMHVSVIPDQQDLAVHGHLAAMKVPIYVTLPDMQEKSLKLAGFGLLIVAVGGVVKALGEEGQKEESEKTAKKTDMDPHYTRQQIAVLENQLAIVDLEAPTSPASSYRTGGGVGLSRSGSWQDIVKQSSVTDRSQTPETETPASVRDRDSFSHVAGLQSPESAHPSTGRWA